ncbi:MAG: glycosyl transferase family 1, partial [Pseudomonadota bacterium]|nr:glycosyl transferase family 1 [Pseudomonadota bacterium]
MRVVFIHQNMPGQYKHLAPRLAADGHEVVFITKRRNIELPGVRRIVYDLSREPNGQGHRYARHYDGQLLYGQAVARVLIKLRDEGFHPDLICAHSGWGEAMFIKDIFPDSSLQVFSEFFYRGQGADIGFEDKGEASLDAQCRARARNAHMLIAMADAESLIAPTIWQWQQHPRALRERMVVIHDGIDSAACQPDPTATFTLPTGEILSREDEVITYMARNLEPYRGFHK